MVKWQKARKKPLIIEYREVEVKTTFKDRKGEYVETKEGLLFAFEGEDFIIKGIVGELYPIKKDIFYKTYELIDDEGKFVICPRCGYSMLRKDMKLFGNKCIRCGNCIACDGV